MLLILYTTQRFPSPIPPRSTSLTHPRHGLPFSEQPGLTICTDQGEANRPVRFPDAYLHPGSSTHRTIVSYHHERRRQPPNPSIHQPGHPRPTWAYGSDRTRPTLFFPGNPTRRSLHAQNNQALCRISTLVHASAPAPTLPPTYKTGGVCEICRNFLLASNAPCPVQTR